MLSEQIKKLAENTDKLDSVQELLAEAESYETQLTEARNKIDEMTSQIASLRDTNMKLFLSQTSKVDEEEKPEPTGDELIEQLLNKE